MRKLLLWLAMVIAMVALILGGTAAFLYSRTGEKDLPQEAVTFGDTALTPNGWDWTIPVLGDKVSKHYQSPTNLTVQKLGTFTDTAPQLVLPDWVTRAEVTITAPDGTAWTGDTSTCNTYTYAANGDYQIIVKAYHQENEPPADAQGWDLMWNEKYAGKILQFNNSRDAFGTAMYKDGLDVNTTDKAQWDQALQTLLDQRPLVKGYVMDEIFNSLESGEAAIGAYYAGDYFTMAEAQAENVDLQFYYPEPTNYFIDAMCIPTGCQNQELAEIFINYMLSEEPAVANAEYISYASPNALVYESETYQADMGQEAMEILYPDLGDFAQQYNTLAYRNLSNEMLDYVNTLWETLKIN